MGYDYIQNLDFLYKILSDLLWKELHVCISSLFGDYCTLRFQKTKSGKMLRILMNSEILNRLNIMHVFHDLRKFYLIFQKKKKTLVER